MSNTAGGIIANSLTRYDPFGNYRTWPGSNVNPLISDRGFTGHVHDNTGPYPTQNVGLIYMNARYYLPEVGRFVSADMIVPNPSNPQSYNRYTYVLNSPLSLIDPTGHREIGADGNDLLFFQPPPTIAEQIAQEYNVYGITFSADEGEEWTEQQMTIVLRAASAADRQLRLAGRFSGYMPGTAFRRIYGNYTMLRSSKTRDFGAETFSLNNTIEFYDHAFDDTRDLSQKLNVVHEFGHAFNGEVVTRGDGNPYDELGVALNDREQLGNFRARDGMDDYPWQQSDQDENGEYFADYFLNWVYDSFLGNAAGVSQQNWMSQHIPTWLR